LDIVSRSRKGPIVTATDTDAGQTLAYSIVGGADAAKFTIDSNTGELRFVSAPNYEASTDTGGNNVYDVIVQISDRNGGTDTQAIAVTVTDVNETPTDLSLSANSVAENATNGTVVGRVTGTDPDRGDTKTYSLTDSAGGRFAINRSTGVLTVANGALLNYEAAASHTVIVRVMDVGGLTYDKSFIITLTDANEPLLLPNIPGSPVTSHSMAALANGTTVFSLSDVSSETGKVEFPPPGDFRKVIEITTETPSPVYTENPEEKRLDIGREEFHEHVGSTIEKKELLLTSVSENKTEGKVTAQDHGGSASLASDHVGFQQPDRTSESAIGTTMTLGLAGVVLQGAVGTKEKLITNIRRPRAHTEGTALDMKSEPSIGDDNRSSHNESGHGDSVPNKPGPT